MMLQTGPMPTVSMDGSKPEVSPESKPESKPESTPKLKPESKPAVMAVYRRFTKAAFASLDRLRLLPATARWCSAHLVRVVCA